MIADRVRSAMRRTLSMWSKRAPGTAGPISSVDGLSSIQPSGRNAARSLGSSSPAMKRSAPAGGGVRDQSPSWRGMGGGRVNWSWRCSATRSRSRVGRGLLRIDPADWSQHALPAGPFVRPIDVVATPDGQLLVVDFGHFEMLGARGLEATRGSGKVWKIKLN
jgi:hypothetical protein